MTAEIEIIIRLVIALILGSAIGYERKIHNKKAGMRTHAMVCVGAALFAGLASLALEDSSAFARIAAGLVTGIGFLGAGMIFKSEKRIEGLTTASEIWVLGAIGLTIGSGFYLIAIAATLIVMFILVPEKYLEREAVKETRKKKRELREKDN